MPTPPLSKEAVVEAYNAIAETGSVRHAAARLDLGERTIRYRIHQGRSRGLLHGYPLLPTEKGLELRSEGITLDKHGEVKSTSKSFATERASEHKAKEGLVVVRETVQSDGTGAVSQTWTQYKPGQRTPEQLAEDFEKAFENFEPLAPSIILPKENSDDDLAVYVLADWHLGLYAWGEETGGGDWDLKIARKAILEAYMNLIRSMPACRHALILGIGDLVHSDNRSNQTERSRNVLDVDGRYSKVIGELGLIVAEISEQVAAKHEQIQLVFKEGNHDPHSTVGLRNGLHMYWRKEDRIDVCLSPNPFFYRVFGCNLIGATHGHTTKPDKLPGIMAEQQREAWGKTTCAHWHTGHLHHDRVTEIGTTRVWQHRAPVEKDIYHAQHGYMAGRSVYAGRYNKNEGAKGVFLEPVK